MMTVVRTVLEMDPSSVKGKPVQLDVFVSLNNSYFPLVTHLLCHIKKYIEREFVSHCRSSQSQTLEGKPGEGFFTGKLSCKLIYLQLTYCTG